MTTSSRAGTSQKSAGTPASDGGDARTSFNSAFWSLVSFAAFSFLACPVTTEHNRLAFQSRSQSETVRDDRSTVDAIISELTPMDAYKTASAFMRIKTMVSLRFFQLRRVARSAGSTEIVVMNSLYNNGKLEQECGFV
ncbi:MAG: hypothetical protein ACRDNZ_07155 [Streptosporangiaceae bacterium]